MPSRVDLVDREQTCMPRQRLPGATGRSHRVVDHHSMCYVLKSSVGLVLSQIPLREDAKEPS